MMDDVKIATGCFIPKGKVEFYCSAKSAAGKKLIAEAQKDGRLVSVVGCRKPASTVITATGGTVFVTDVSLTSIHGRMNAAGGAAEE